MMDLCKNCARFEKHGKDDCIFDHHRPYFNRCEFFDKKRSTKDKIVDLIKRVWRGSKTVLIVIVILIAVIITSVIDYNWTKSSLEDLSGKEVKPSTVIWTMMKTNNGGGTHHHHFSK